MKNIEDIVGKENVKYDEPMSKHTSFKVGGNADIFVKIDNQEKLLKILNMDSKNKITIMGNGTNLLVKDEGIRGIVIKYTADSYKIHDCNVPQECTEKANTKNTGSNLSENEIEGNQGEEYKIVEVDAGMLNAKLAQELLKHELTGFEFAAGIPGTLGGAIVMNAGAFGSEMQEIILETTYIDLADKKIYNIKNEEHKFEYRSSIFENKNTIILNTKIKLKKGKYDTIKTKMDEYRKRRMDSQPLDMPSAGSTFKRGTDFITAKLIDEAGLKGYKIGGAQVSTKHAGFIVNTGDATAKDILDLIKYVQDNILKKYGKKIETEVRILGL